MPSAPIDPADTAEIAPAIRVARALSGGAVAARLTCRDPRELPDPDRAVVARDAGSPR